MEALVVDRHAIPLQLKAAVGRAWDHDEALGQHVLQDAVLQAWPPANVDDTVPIRTTPHPRTRQGTARARSVNDRVSCLRIHGRDVY